MIRKVQGLLLPLLKAFTHIIHEDRTIAVAKFIRDTVQFQGWIMWRLSAPTAEHGRLWKALVLMKRSGRKFLILFTGVRGELI